MRIDKLTTPTGCKYECWDVYECSIVGSAVVRIGPDHVYLQDINIASAYRGQGIGSELLHRIIEDHDLPVVADVFEDRVPWYERNGFRRTGRARNLVRMVRNPTPL